MNKIRVSLFQTTKLEKLNKIVEYYIVNNEKTFDKRGDAMNDIYFPLKKKDNLLCIQNTNSFLIEEFHSFDISG